MTHEEEKKIHPTRFKPGTTGNPNGRPKKGSNRTLDEVAEGLINLAKDKVVNLSKSIEKLPIEKQFAILERAFRLYGITIKQPDGVDPLQDGTVQAIQVIFGKPKVQIEDAREDEYEC